MKGCTHTMALLDLFAFFEEEASAVFDGGEARAKLKRFLLFKKSPIHAPSPNIDANYCCCLVRKNMFAIVYDHCIVGSSLCLLDAIQGSFLKGRQKQLVALEATSRRAMRLRNRRRKLLLSPF